MNYVWESRGCSRFPEFFLSGGVGVAIHNKTKEYNETCTFKKKWLCLCEGKVLDYLNVCVWPEGV